MKVVYFAWVRQQVGRGEETVDPPPGVRTAGDLITWLASRGGGYAAALSDRRRIRVAINQERSDFDAFVWGDDEIAVFPPVTGG